jgi:AraC-like DNA-binding protein
MFRSSSHQQYRYVRSGVETLPWGCCLPRHRHRGGYATIVLEGRFTEASFAGRFEVGPGDVLLHGHFDCHSNAAPRTVAPRILRLPWNHDAIEGLFQVRDIDLLVRLAERDPWEATSALAESLSPRIEREADWPERLARDLAENSSLSLTDWAEHHGLVSETLSRGFRKAFGVTPKLFRLEVRTRAAWRAIVRSGQSLTTIAHTSRFADLAHMSRSVTAFTGASPAHWRRSHGSSVASTREARGSP